MPRALVSPRHQPQCAICICITFHDKGGFQLFTPLRCLKIIENVNTFNVTWNEFCMTKVYHFILQFPFSFSDSLPFSQEFASEAKWSRNALLDSNWSRTRRSWSRAFEQFVCSYICFYKIFSLGNVQNSNNYYHYLLLLLLSLTVTLYNTW